MSPPSHKTLLLIRKYTRRFFLSGLTGALAGTAASILLISLDAVTNYRDQYPSILFGLPFAGLFIGWMYHRYGKEVAEGTNLIIEEIHELRKTIPFRMSPFVLFGTLLTHLFGGSAGREGTAVQMGASLADQLHRWFTIEVDERKIFLIAGTGAGFGTAIGAPWAGALFGMEVLYIGRFKLFAWIECTIASFVGYGVTLLLRAPHTHYASIALENLLEFKPLLWVVLVGAMFGLAARLFSTLTRVVERLGTRFVPYPPLRPFLGGIFLIALYYLEGSYRYVGLGIPYIQEAFSNPALYQDSALKMFFTSITIGSGFKGGEFVPLVFIGSTLGSALSAVIPVSITLLAALGFAAVFAGASNAPIACSVMAMEIFGHSIAPYAFVACFTAYYFSGPRGIYKTQRVHARKHEKIVRFFDWLRAMGRPSR